MKNTMPQEMTAVMVNHEDGKLIAKRVAIPRPGKGQVLIKMLAAPINPSDLAKVKEFSADDADFFIPGIEGCGKVVAAGEGILPALMLGKRVAFFAKYKRSGSWAEYVLTPAGSCFPVPKSVPSEQAGMTIVNPLTALAFLDYAKKNKHKAVVNTAAAGALGKMIASLFAKNNIAVLNIVRSNASHEELKRQNNPFVLNSSEPGFPEKLRDWCLQNKATLMFDAVGGELINPVLDYLPAGFTILLYGNLSQEKISFLPTQLVRENKKMIGFFLGHWIEEQGIIKTIRHLVKANQLLKSGMNTNIQAIVALEDAQQAINLYEKNMTKGKVLLKPGQE